MADSNIGVVFTVNETNDEMSIFIKDMDGRTLDVDEVIRIIASIDIKAAIDQSRKNRMNVQSMPKGVM